MDKAIRNFEWKPNEFNFKQIINNLKPFHRRGFINIHRIDVDVDDIVHLAATHIGLRKVCCIENLNTLNLYLNIFSYKYINFLKKDNKYICYNKNSENGTKRANLIIENIHNDFALGILLGYPLEDVIYYMDRTMDLDMINVYVKNRNHWIDKNLLEFANIL